MSGYTVYYLRDKKLDAPMEHRVSPSQIELRSLANCRPEPCGDWKWVLGDGGADWRLWPGTPFELATSSGTLRVLAVMVFHMTHQAEPQPSRCTRRELHSVTHPMRSISSNACGSEPNGTSLRTGQGPGLHSV